MKACHLRQSYLTQEQTNIVHFTANVFFFLEMSSLGGRHLFINQHHTISLMAGKQICFPALAQSHDSAVHQTYQDALFQNKK